MGENTENLDGLLKDTHSKGWSSGFKQWIKDKARPSVEKLHKRTFNVTKTREEGMKEAMDGEDADPEMTKGWKKEKN